MTDQTVEKDTVRYTPPGTEWLGDPGEDTYPFPDSGWVCFHCGLWCKTIPAAQVHFGKTPDKFPGCLIQTQHDYGLLVRLRQLESEVDRLRQELAQVQNKEST